MTTTTANKKRRFSGPEAAELIGISYRQLDYWDRKEIVRPSAAKAKGSGSRREYSREDLMSLSVFKTLNYMGFGFDWISTIIGDVEGELLRADNNTLLVVDWDGGRIVDASEMRDSLTKQVLVIIPLHVLRDSFLERLNSER